MAKSMEFLSILTIYFNTLVECESWFYKYEYKLQKPES